MNNHILIDASDLDDSSILDALTQAHIHLFFEADSKRLEAATVKRLLEHTHDVCFVTTNQPNQNLSLLISTYLGEMSIKHPRDNFFLCTKDKSFDLLVSYYKSKNLNLSIHGSVQEIITQLTEFSRIAFPRPAFIREAHDNTRTIYDFGDSPFVKEPSIKPPRMPTLHTAPPIPKSRAKKYLSHSLMCQGKGKRPKSSAALEEYINFKLPGCDSKAMVESFVESGFITITDTGVKYDFTNSYTF